MTQEIMRPKIYNKYISSLPANDEDTDQPSAADDLVALLKKYSQSEWFTYRHHKASCLNLTHAIEKFIQENDNTATAEQCIALINKHLAKDDNEQDTAISSDGDLAYLLAIWLKLHDLNTDSLDARFQQIDFDQLVPVEAFEASEAREAKKAHRAASVHNDPEGETKTTSKPRRSSSIDAEALISCGVISTESAMALRKAEQQELQQAAETETVNERSTENNHLDNEGFSPSDLPISL
ncbi:MAG: hypothetical protein P1U63_12985 [Coxiellaceae bacterium]|nr:hypothetical protein [Coxiellaceae bacterium]